MQLLRLRWNVSREVDAVSQGGRKTRLVQGAREEGVEEYTMSFSFLSCPFLLFVRPSDQRGSPCQDPAGNRTTRRPPDHRKETQTAVVWSCFLFIRSGQNHLARHSKRGKKTRQTEEEVGRQHQEMSGLEFAKSQRAVENWEKWRKLAVKSSVVPQRPSRLRDR